MLGTLAACSAAEPPATGSATRFELVDAARSGIDFVHRTGATGDYHLVETMGSGVCLLDYDSDGDHDVYLVQSVGGNALYRNDGDFRFHDVAADAGVADAAGYGMGCAAADFDGDRRVDLFVSNHGPDVLYRNRGDGSFEDVTTAAGLVSPGWSASAAWLDADGDGRLDLYVVSYVGYDRAAEPWCGDVARDLRAYCHVDGYPGAADVLYLQMASGRFRDATVEAGLDRSDGKGLGVVATDLDDDGDADLVVANDSTANFVWRNDGRGRFTDVAAARGLAYDLNGRAEACMGVDAGDVDGDGDVDLFVTNFSSETNTLYVQDASGGHRDVSYPSGVGAPSYVDLGFGTAFLDADHDGHLDLFVVNGHIHPNAAALYPEQEYAQRDRLLRNRGDGRFEDVTDAAGPGLAAAAVGRGLAYGDLDGDGDLDLVVNNSGAAPHLLRQTAVTGAWLVVRLRGRPANTAAIGARVTVRAGALQLVREARASGSYLSTHAPELHFGLGEHERVDAVTVRWPSGQRTERTDVAARQLLEVSEGGS